ncbi:MAG: hypothetical protein ACK4TJ_17205 [Tabrizicola sp.]
MTLVAPAPSTIAASVAVSIAASVAGPAVTGMLSAIVARDARTAITSLGAGFPALAAFAPGNGQHHKRDHHTEDRPDMHVRSKLPPIEPSRRTVGR